MHGATTTTPSVQACWTKRVSAPIAAGAWRRISNLKHFAAWAAHKCGKNNRIGRQSEPGAPLSGTVPATQTSLTDNSKVGFSSGLQIVQKLYVRAAQR